MSGRVGPTGRPGEHGLVLEHATRALSPLAERRLPACAARASVHSLTTAYD
jgi:hypothetical protein